MGPDPSGSPVISNSPTRLASPTRRTILSLLGVGVLAGGLASLVEPEPTEAKKKKRRNKKKKRRKGKRKCTGGVRASASASEEAALLQMINNFRARNGGLPPLSRHPQLDSAALFHSQDMARRCYFDHVSPDGTNPSQRMTAAGYPGVPISENIYKGSRSFTSAAEAFEAFRKSDGHRANMLDSRASQIGIGTARGGSGFMNWTNVFGSPPDV